MKLVADVDKITSNLEILSTEVENFSTAISAYEGSNIDCPLEEISGTLSSYKSSIAEDLNKLNTSSHEYNTLVKDCCTDYKSNEENNRSISIETIEEIIANNKEITVDYQGNAASRLTGLPTTELASAGIINAKKTLEKYAGCNIADLSNEEFVEYIAAAALIDYERSGILPSVTLAQAILESGWGNHSIGNNVFGIKTGDNWTGKRINTLTSEQDADGSYHQQYDDFRDYDSVVDGVADHNDLLNTKNYAPVKEACKNGDPYEACRQLKKCRYATSHTYTEKLIALIDQYDLTQYDPK